MTACCPFCGAAILYQRGVLEPVIVTLRPMAQRAVRVIIARPGILAADLVAEVYRDKRGAMPLRPVDSMQVALSHARPALEAVGYTIKGARTTGYYIVRKELSDANG